MKDQVKGMYDQITMPEETAEKIQRAMAEKREPVKQRFGSFGRSAAAIAAMLALVLLISPEVRAAVNGLMVKYFWPDSDITIYEIVDPEGEVEGTVAVVDTEAPAFARIVNGRLYFLGNGEKIDITDQIAEDAPYYYTYVDEYGLTHEMVVAYSGTIENFGIYEFIWKEEAGVKTWTAGTGRNFMCLETEARYPWVDIVWEDLNIPWPMPEE